MTISRSKNNPGTSSKTHSNSGLQGRSNPQNALPPKYCVQASLRLCGIRHGGW